MLSVTVGEISLSGLGSKLILILNILCFFIIIMYLATSKYHQDCIYPNVFLGLYFFFFIKNGIKSIVLHTTWEAGEMIVFCVIFYL